MAKGYELIRAELRSYDGKVFTISRQFNDNLVYLAETPFDKFNASDAKKLSSRHNSNNDANLSSYLLTLLGLNGKQLKKNNLNDKKDLSFRDLSRFCIVSEDKISIDTSPIYSGQYSEETVNKSLFKLLLTGKDDDDLELISNQEIVKNKIRGRLELIKETIENMEKARLEIKKRVDSLENDKINIKIEELVKLVNTAQKAIFEEEQKRQIIWHEMGHIKSELTQIEELTKRFELLNAHYESDLKRLEFINEGKQYLDQLGKVNCPLCNNLIEQKLLEPYDDDQTVLNSVKLEFFKIRTKQTELIKTISSLGDARKELGKKVNTQQVEFDKINQFISDKLKPIHEANYQNLQNFLRLRDEKRQVSLIDEDISKLKKDFDYYSEKLNEKQKKAPEVIMPEQIYSDLSKEIQFILSTWGIDCKTVRYDPTVNDIEIDGEKRHNMGKGYRAIYLSAFMIAAMFYCINKNLKHPSFLVLDSPLTSYKERDHTALDTDDSKDQIPEDIQNGFYRSIANLQNIHEVQIIVIDNKDPPEDVKSKITYEHFSKNQSKGRYGFYSISTK